VKGKVRRTRSGETITDEMIDALAAEAERGYDPASLRPRRVGRPSLSDEGQSPRIQYRVGAATYLRAWQRASRDGVSTVSALSRALLQAYADGKVRLPAAKPAPAAKARTPKPKPAR
jgi:CRISPR-associated endonuclease/helicase Cas3